ncbi:MAG: response regulator, partial [Coleofasciculaceae cyanobacterium]
QLKQDNDLKTIPIVVLTTSSNPKDIEICYKCGVNGYMQKPIGIEKLQKTVESFVEHWLEVTVLPDNSLLGS